MTFDFEFGVANMTRGYMSSVGYWYQDRPCFSGAVIRPDTNRFPPQDPLEPTAIICRLIELERVGRYDEAAVVCAEYAEKFAAGPWAEVMKLRSLAYREETEGFDSVSNSCRQMSEQTNNQNVARQAASLLWFHESNTNALFGIDSFGRFKAYIDGRLIGEGDDPTSLFVYPVSLAPGEHEIEMELTSTRPDGFLLEYLRGHGFNVAADGTWQYSKQRSKDWPAGAKTDVEWRPVESARHGLPKMIYWQFVPNSYIKMQSALTGVRPWMDWGTGKEGKVTAYLRKVFVVPEVKE